MNQSELLPILKDLLRESLKLDPDAAIDDHMPLTGGEYDLDSLDALMLVTTVEKRFGMKIPNDALSRDDFASGATLAQTIARQMNSAPSGGA